MIPVIHSWSEGLMAAIAIAGALLWFERRLAKVEAKLCLVMKMIKFPQEEETS